MGEVVVATLSSDLESVTTAITTAFTTSDLISIVTTGVGAVAGYVVLWFGVRYIAKLVKSGIFKGKFRL